MKHYYLKTWLLHFCTAIFFIIGIGLCLIFFVVSNQKLLLPAMSNYMSRQSIPFDVIAPKNKSIKMIKAKGINISKSNFTYREKQQILAFIDKYAKYGIANKENILSANNRSDFFTDDFYRSIKLTDKISQMLKTPHSSIDNIITTGLGADKQGKFVILDYIIQSDSPDLANYQIKLYLNQNKLLFRKYGQSYLVINDKGGLAKLYSNFNNINLINTGYQSVQELFGKLDLSNVYNDHNNLNDSTKFQNLTNGMSEGSKKSLATLIMKSNGNFDNYALSEYIIKDVPNKVKMIVEVGGIDRTYKYSFVYSDAKKEITEIETEK